MLLEATAINDQLSSKIIAGAATASDNTANKRKVLSLMGGIERDIYVHLEKKGAEWKKIEEIDSISKLEEICNDSELMVQLSGYHCIVICLGSNDIQEMKPGDNCISLAQRYMTCVNMLPKMLGSLVMVVKLPPARLTLNLSDVIVFNGALTPSEGVVIAESPELRQMVRSKIYNMEGGLTEAAAKVIASTVNTELQIPDDKPLTTDEVKAKLNAKVKVDLVKPKTEVKREVVLIRDDEFSDFVNIDRFSFGLIIGKGGRDISAMQTNTKTRIKMMYYDPISGADVPGALIRGDTQAAVDRARQAIKARLDSEKRKVEGGAGVSPIATKKGKI